MLLNRTRPAPPCGHPEKPPQASCKCKSEYLTRITFEKLYTCLGSAMAEVEKLCNEMSIIMEALGWLQDSDIEIRDYYLCAILYLMHTYM